MPGSCWLDNLSRNAVSLKADKMAQQTKGFVSKPEDQSSILGTHIAGENKVNRYLQVVF